MFELAARAAVSVRAVYLMSARGRGQEQMTALAARIIGVTAGVLRCLGPGHLDAAIFRELAYLCGRSGAIRTAASWACLIALLIVIPLRCGEGGGSAESRAAALTLLVGVTLLAQLSQRLYLWADARGAALSQTPEMLIGAIGQTARLTGIAMDGGALAGAFLWSVSPSRRALALAKRFGIERNRALSLLEQQSAASGHYSELSFEQAEPVYNMAAQTRHVLTLIRWKRTLLIAGSAAVYGAAYSVGPRAWRLPMYLLGAAGLLLLLLKLDEFLDRRFLNAMERRIALPVGGLSCCLRAGDIIEVDRGYPWDLGKVFLTPDELV